MFLANSSPYNTKQLKVFCSIKFEGSSPLLIHVTEWNFSAICVFGRSPL